MGSIDFFFVAKEEKKPNEMTWFKSIKYDDSSLFESRVQVYVTVGLVLLGSNWFSQIQQSTWKVYSQRLNLNFFEARERKGILVDSTI